VQWEEALATGTGGQGSIPMGISSLHIRRGVRALCLLLMPKQGDSLRARGVPLVYYTVRKHSQQTRSMIGGRFPVPHEKHRSV
jgi:hypothetical protein